jgi:hypothetical protein
MQFYAPRRVQLAKVSVLSSAPPFCAEAKARIIDVVAGRLTERGNEDRRDHRSRDFCEIAYKYHENQRDKIFSMSDIYPVAASGGTGSNSTGSMRAAQEFLIHCGRIAAGRAKPAMEESDLGDQRHRDVVGTHNADVK